METTLEVISNGFFSIKGAGFTQKRAVESIAEKYGTPCYVYSCHSLLSQINKFKTAFKNVDAPLICFSVKANSNLTLLKMMEEQGLGADVVSGGELRKALLAQFPPKKIVFAGVGKKEDEIELGVKENILFNIRRRRDRYYRKICKAT